MAKDSDKNPQEAAIEKIATVLRDFNKIVDSENKNFSGIIQVQNVIKGQTLFAYESPVGTPERKVESMIRTFANVDNMLELFKDKIPNPEKVQQFLQNTSDALKQIKDGKVTEAEKLIQSSIKDLEEIKKSNEPKITQKKETLKDRVANKITSKAEKLSNSLQEAYADVQKNAAEKVTNVKESPIVKGVKNLHKSYSGATKEASQIGKEMHEEQKKLNIQIAVGKAAAKVGIEKLINPAVKSGTEAIVEGKKLGIEVTKEIAGAANDKIQGAYNDLKTDVTRKVVYAKKPQIVKDVQKIAGEVAQALSNRGKSIRGDVEGIIMDVQDVPYNPYNKSAFPKEIIKTVASGAADIAKDNVSGIASESTRIVKDTTRAVGRALQRQARQFKDKITNLKDKNTSPVQQPDTNLSIVVKKPRGRGRGE